MNLDPDFQASCRNFVRHCGKKFGWEDVSTEVIMDIGCGRQLHCGKAILQEYPDVRAIIGIDKDPKVIFNLRISDMRITCTVADIERRYALQRYLGKMTKVLSTRVLQELADIQTAFRNMYDLLRPGGEAGLHFYSMSSKHEWFMEMIKIPRWKAFYKGNFNSDWFLKGISRHEYIEMVENIGFEVVECLKKKIEYSFKSDAECADNLYETFEIDFKVPSKLVEEFRRESLQVYTKVSERDSNRKLIYRATTWNLLLAKPADGCRS